MGDDTNVTEKGRSWVRSIETIHRWSRIKIITWSETRLRFVERRYWTTSRMRVASLMGILRIFCVHDKCNNARHKKVHATSKHTKTKAIVNISNLIGEQIRMLYSLYQFQMKIQSYSHDMRYVLKFARSNYFAFEKRIRQSDKIRTCRISHE